MCQTKSKIRKIEVFLPRSASEGNELLDSCGNHPFDWVGYEDDLVTAFSDIASTQKRLDSK